MDIKRSVSTGYWRDPWIRKLPPEAKLLYLYLFTCDSSNMAGLFTICCDTIAFDTGIKESKLANLIEIFVKSDKIAFDGEIMWLKNARKHQTNSSPQQIACIMKDIKRIHGCKIKHEYCEFWNIPYADPIDTPSMPYANPIDREDDKFGCAQTDTPSIPHQCPIDTPSIPRISFSPSVSYSVSVSPEDCTNNKPTNSVPSDDSELLVSSSLRTTESNEADDAILSDCWKKINAMWPLQFSANDRETIRGLILSTSWRTVRDATKNAISNNPQNPIAYIKSEARRMHKQVAQNV